MFKNSLLIVVSFLFILNCIAANANWRHIETLPHKNGGVQRQICLAPDYCLIINYSKILYLSRDQGLTWDSIYKFDYQLNQIQTMYPSIDVHYYYYYEPQYFGSELYFKQIHKYTDNYMTKEEVLYRDTSSQERIFWAPYMLNNDTGFVWCDELVGRHETGNIQVEYFILITYDGWKTYKRREVPLYFWASYAFHTRSDKSNLLCSSIYPFVHIKGDDTVKRGGIIANYNFYEDKWTLLHAFPVREEGYEGPFTNGPTGLQMLNDSVGYGYHARQVTYEPGDYRHFDVVFRTRDGCKTWERVMDTLRESFPSDIQDMSFYDEKNGIVVGRSGKVLMTNDGGDSWIMDDPEQFEKSKVLAVMFVDWAGQFPIIGTRLDGDVYRYEGDFFKFDFKSPDLFYPKPNTIGQSPNVLFRWEELRDATDYEFQLATDANFENIILESSGKKMQIPYNNLEYFTEYWWRVSSTNGEEVLWSESQKFRTKMPPVKLEYPECSSLQAQPNSVLLKWSSVKGAQHYRIRLLESIDIESLIFESDEIVGTEYQLNDLLNQKIYYWQVQAYREDELGDWSTLCDFTTEPGTSVAEPNSVSFIHPNPASEYIEISVDINPTVNRRVDEGSEIKIFNTLGECVRNLTPTLSEGKRVRIDISHLPRGVYYLRIGSKTQMFVKV